MTSMQDRTDPRPSRARRSGLRRCGVLVAGLVVVGMFTPATAEAAAYRYWSYWSGTSGSWTYASVGAGSTRPADGAVEGWRFAVSVGASSSTIPPRTSASFDAICGGVSRSEGQKRVALVVDFGVAADAPSGERPPNGVVVHCAVVPSSATGAAVLLDAFKVRSSNGLVCGIDGYPRTECAAVVRDLPEPSASTSTPRRPAGPSDSEPAGSDRVESNDSGTPTARRSNDDADGAPTSQAASEPSQPPASQDQVTPAPSGAPDASATDDPVLVTTASPTDDAGSPWGLVVAAALLVAFGATALVLRRRTS